MIYLKNLINNKLYGVQFHLTNTFKRSKNENQVFGAYAFGR